MGKQPSSFPRPRREPTGPKYNIISNGISIGAHFPRRLFRGGVEMHPHSGKVVAETLLHILPESRLKRLAGAGKDLAYTGNCRPSLPVRLSREALDTWWYPAHDGSCR